MVAALLLSLALRTPLYGPAARAQYRALLARMMFDDRNVEYAAFLVAGGDGALRAVYWPDGEHLSASFGGRIPAGSIAIMHTHPTVQPMPSRHDRAEAQAIGLPIIVVTPLAVTVAWPDGTMGKLSQ